MVPASLTFQKTLESPWRPELISMAGMTSVEPHSPQYQTLRGGVRSLEPPNECWTTPLYCNGRLAAHRSLQFSETSEYDAMTFLRISYRDSSDGEFSENWELSIPLYYPFSLTYA